MNSYTTVDGDMVDAIIFKHYGSLDTFGVVLAHNRHLADYGSVLPAGVEIELPGVEEKKEVRRVRLWS